MAVTRASEAPTFDVPGFHFTGCTAPSRGATELATWRLRVEAGAISDLHHLDREEVFILLEGVMTATIDGEDITLSTGDALAVPPHSLLQVSNKSDAPAHAVVCLPVGAQATLADGRELGAPPWAR